MSSCPAAFSKARAPQGLKHFLKKYSIGCIITEAFENSPNTNFVCVMVETWWSSENCFQAVLRQSLKAETAAGFGHRLVKPFSPGASMRGAVSEGRACLEVISVLSTLWRRINPKRSDLLKKMQPWLVFTSHRTGIWKARKHPQDHGHKTMQEGGGVQLQTPAQESWLCFYSEIKDKLSTGLESNTGSKLR